MKKFLLFLLVSAIPTFSFAQMYIKAGRILIPTLPGNHTGIHYYQYPLPTNVRPSAAGASLANPGLLNCNIKTGADASARRNFQKDPFVSPGYNNSAYLTKAGTNIPLLTILTPE